MQHRITEIESFLAQQDYSLAVRRMLDICLDADNDTLLQTAIDWSSAYQQQTHINTTELPATFFEQANAILNQLKKLPLSANAVQTDLLKVDSISKTYSNSKFSLKPISLHVKTTDVMGVVGENGNGKTTLLRCLAGQLAFDSGNITYSGLSTPDEYDVKHYVAFIPQRIPRWYGMLKDNLHFSAAISGIHGSKNELMVNFMLERLGLTQYAHLNWNQISSGYRTRFEIARILLQKPSLLILDEPLANLDINAQQTILTDLKFMAANHYQSMGIILSSQQLHEVEKVANNVLFIKQGKCLYQTSEKQQQQGFAIEVETHVTKAELLEVLGIDYVAVQFNGGFYTITSATMQPNEIVSKLLNSNISISYFRDITYSTKRYFN